MTTFEEYSLRAHKLAVYPHDCPTYPVLGLCGEAGEVAELVKKAIRDNNGEIVLSQLQKELGDVLWYLNEIAVTNGLSLSAVAEGNIAKLEDRLSRGVIHGKGNDR